MKSLIQLLFEETLEEAAATIQEAEASGLALSIINSDYLTLTLYRPAPVADVLLKAEPGIGKTRTQEYSELFSSTAIVAQIIAFKTDEGYQIASVVAKEKFGPLMYEILSSMVGWIAPGNKVSNDALRIWKKFFERKDVEKDEAKRRGFKALSYRYKVTKKTNYKKLFSAHKNLQKQLQKKLQVHPRTLDSIITKAGSLVFNNSYNG